VDFVNAIAADSHSESAVIRDAGFFRLNLRKSALLFLVFLHELIHSSFRIDEFLFSGKKRMALGTDFHVDGLLGRTSLNRITASAHYSRHFIFGMPFVFHKYLLQ
jgi:hypothetical protein